MWGGHSQADGYPARIVRGAILWRKDNRGMGVLRVGAFEDYAAGEPGLRDVIVSLGANDVLQGAPASAVENSLRTLIATLKGTYASDGTGAGLKVVVTTIPPLGMSGSDPREAVREAVNTWLLDNGTTADQVVDIASAVADSSNPNLVSSSYLSNGTPSAAYYTAIANAVATALAGPPPFPL
jgi:lysophospholipase L1-like esterase